MKPSEHKIVALILFILILGIVNFFSGILSVSILFIVFLAAIGFLIIDKIGVQNKTLVTLFCIVFLTHLLFVLFIYYANFQPFSHGRGDYTNYNSTAIQIAERIKIGNFSLEGLGVGHCYPVIVGYIYAFTSPSMLMGEILNAWIVALIAILAYLTVIAIGGSKKGAFLVGLIINFYPSLLFYSSLLLKDALVVFFTLCGILLLIKLIKRFDWRLFVIFYLVLGATVHFRFYIGYAIMLTFIICWFLFGNFQFKKRVLFLILIIPLFGFIPQFFAGQGYWGAGTTKTFLNQESITYYREVVYAPGTTSASTYTIETGFNSPFKFLKNSMISFSYSLLGPFPWQIKYKRHLLSLFETIPWYVLLFFIGKGIIRNFKQHYKTIFPLLFFSLLVFGTLALFINNFGIITRIRIPAFVSLLCFVPLGLKESNIIYKYLDKIYGKILD